MVAEYRNEGRHRKMSLEKKILEPGACTTQSNACIKLCHNIYRNLFSHTIGLILSTKNTQSTQVQGHSAVLHPSSRLHGADSHSRMQKTLSLFSCSFNFICFYHLNHSSTSSPPSPDLFSHSPACILLLTVPPSLPFSIIFAKCNEHVTVCMELKCAIQMDIDVDVSVSSDLQ